MFNSKGVLNEKQKNNNNLKYNSNISTYNRNNIFNI